MRLSRLARLTALLLIGPGLSAAAESLSTRTLAVIVDQTGVARATTAPPDGRAPQIVQSGTCKFDHVPSPADAEALVKRIATEESFYPDFVLSVARTESHFHMEVISPKGAIGLMQLMPATALRFAVEICDPADNVRGGVRYLRWLHDRYKNPFFILAAYNAGETAVDEYRGVPPYPATVQYVAAVLNDFYTWPLPGPAGVAPGAGRTKGRQAAQETAPGGGTVPGWSQGFVMHVEN
jgi:hypothetical protein